MVLLRLVRSGLIGVQCKVTGGLIHCLIHCETSWALGACRCSGNQALVQYGFLFLILHGSLSSDEGSAGADRESGSTANLDTVLPAFKSCCKDCRDSFFQRMSEGPPLEGWR